MKHRTLIILAVLSLPAFAQYSLAEDSLIGEWVALSTSRTGLGGTRTYETNGIVSIGFGALLGFNYKLDGAKLIFSGENCSLAPQNFNVAENILTLTDPQTGKEQKLTRVKGSEGEGIVGKWTGDHYTAAKQVMHFTTNMNCYFSVPMLSSVGSFSLEGDMLTEEFPEQGKSKWKWEIKEDILTLTETDASKTEKYKRKR